MDVNRARPVRSPPRCMQDGVQWPRRISHDKYISERSSKLAPAHGFIHLKGLLYQFERPDRYRLELRQTRLKIGERYVNVFRIARKRKHSHIKKQAITVWLYGRPCSPGHGHGGAESTEITSIN